ncbi:MAG: hypothetical protein H6767_03205 [Candidatus Peribacteria bacterium]|nr:MAG: hypothetical protein H6767_03205 [Candidatus Peribacteria bacterium]
MVQGGNGRTTIRQNAMGDTIIQGPQGRTTIRQNMMGDIDVRGNLPEGISVTPLQQDRWGSRW